MSATLTSAPAEPVDVPVATVRPSKVWYWVSAAVILASALGALAIWLVGKYQVESQIEGYARFLAPSNAELRFKRGGQYTLYYEYRGEIDGTAVAATSVPPAGIQLEMLNEAGESLELRRIGQELRYDAGGFQGISLRRVDVEGDGLFRIAASAPPEAGTFAISVGRGDTPSTESTDQAAWLVGIIGSAIGVIGLIATGVLRSRSRASAAGALPGQPPPPPEPSPATVAAGVASYAGAERLAQGPRAPFADDGAVVVQDRDGTAELESAGQPIVEPIVEPERSFAAPSAATFSATAPLAPIGQEPEPAGVATPPPPPPPAPAASPAPPSWGPPSADTASDPFAIRTKPRVPPLPPPES